MLFREIPPFPTRLWENPTHVGHTLVSSGDFLLHRDSWGSFRNSSWSASSPLRFTWYLIDAVSSFGPSLSLCTIRVAQKFGPPLFPTTNMSLNLLCPDETLSTYTTLVFEFFRVTTFMLFQILLHFSAKVVANNTNKHLAYVSLCMCHKVSLSFEVPVTAFFHTYPCSYCMVSDFVGSQLTFKCKTFIAFVTYKLFVQIV